MKLLYSPPVASAAATVTTIVATASTMMIIAIAASATTAETTTSASATAAAAAATTAHTATLPITFVLGHLHLYRTALKILAVEPTDGRTRGVLIVIRNRRLAF